MKIIPWKRSWLAALLVALGFLLMSHFNAQDRELFNNMAPLNRRGGTMKPETDMYPDERESVDRTIPDEPEYHGPDEIIFTTNTLQPC